MSKPPAAADDASPPRARVAYVIYVISAYKYPAAARTAAAPAVDTDRRLLDSRRSENAAGRLPLDGRGGRRHPERPLPAPPRVALGGLRARPRDPEGPRRRARTARPLRADIERYLAAAGGRTFMRSCSPESSMRLSTSRSSMRRCRESPVLRGFCCPCRSTGPTDPPLSGFDLALRSWTRVAIRCTTS